MGKNGKRIAIGALIIGALGYVAGILTAPKSGKQTRADIGEFRDQGVAEAEKQLKKMHTELNRLIGEAELYATDKNRRHDVNETVSEEVVERATHARQKAREILSALHDGGADDRDLNKALNESSKAIKSLQKYLKK